jgi:glycosyltransferase involved in cell wall biosynthesis
MDYIIAVQTPAYPLSSGAFAVESAFAEHLRELRHSFADDDISRVILIAPQLADADYHLQKHHLGVVEIEHDGIAFLPAYEQSASVAGFWFKTAIPLWQHFRAIVKGAAVVHSGMSFDIRRPMLAMLNLAAWIGKCPVIFIVDIDFRQDARRYLRLGEWSWRKYLANTLILNRFRALQIRLAPRMFQLIMLKSASMVRDFGNGQTHVKNFYDTVHSESQVATDSDLRARQTWLREKNDPLQLCYFGRLVHYKGVGWMIDALKMTRERGCDARLTLIGDGAERLALEKSVTDAGLGDYVTFRTQVPYGEPLFSLLARMHLTLAAPLVEDTPRAAFDSMARGVPILAFDISYFKDLAATSGAVALASWPEARSLADEIIRLDRDRDLLAEMASRGIAFARANTQPIWLARRAAWTRQFCFGKPSAD